MHHSNKSMPSDNTSETNIKEALSLRKMIISRMESFYTDKKIYQEDVLQYIFQGGKNAHNT